MILIYRNKKKSHFNFLEKTDYYILSYEELLMVNGRGGSSGGGGGGPSGPSGGYGTCAGGGAATSSSGSNGGYGTCAGGGAVTSSNNNKVGNSESSQTTTESSTPNPIDNTNNETIVDYLTGIGYELLSDKKDNTYTLGSRKKYVQYEFDIYCSNSDSFSVIKKEGSFTGIRAGENMPNNDYDFYEIIGKDGKMYMKAYDINRDGKIDYAKFN